ncbi:MULTISPECIES: DUF2388 domain-containing protein [unclassified Pseudomonas]|uniref:DUF2388 domain-containing protein n=1 Tax=unclassified Pseudomonas TaxID=196821 RepID=UPI0010328380|nr:MULTISPECIES: DUF2388 domain-containing protein [unclassified Pseudomonas]
MLRFICSAMAALLMAMAANVQASSMVSASISDAVKATSNVTSKLSSSLKDNKIVLAAQDDAASFVATDGSIRGAQLESALQYIRHSTPELSSLSDVELARAILAI